MCSLMLIPADTQTPVNNITVNRKTVLCRPQALYVNFLAAFCGWYAPLGVHSVKHRHQSPKWTILNHVSRFVQCEVIGFQVLLDSLHPRSTRRPGDLLQFSKGEAVKIYLASVSSGILTM